MHPAQRKDNLRYHKNRLGKLRSELRIITATLARHQRAIDKLLGVKKQPDIVQAPQPQAQKRAKYFKKRCRIQCDDESKTRAEHNRNRHSLDHKMIVCSWDGSGPCRLW